MRPGGPKKFMSEHRAMPLIAALIGLHLLQSTTAFADLIPADVSARPDGVSIETRLGAGVQWEASAEDAAVDPGLWDRAVSWAREQLTQSDDTFFNSRTMSSTYDDLWWLKSVRAPEAWGLSTGSGVTVAVVDTGVDYGHEDLAGNIWVNSGEIAGNGIDDDGNGYVDDWRGWDFANGDNDATDDNGHGTHVAGIIGALKDNGKGIAGVAPNAKILGIKVLDKTGSGSFDSIIKGIRYAADAGARVINLSLGAVFDYSLNYIKTFASDFYNAVLKPIQDAILYASGKGSVVVASSGNSGVDVNRSVPAGFTETISVGATTPTGSKAYFSNTGSTLDLTAPGWDILSLRAAGTNLGTTAGAGYTRASGTSMSAPVVSGVIALLLAQDPALNLAGIERRLKFSAKDLGAKGFDTSFGHGQVDALTAITHDYYADGKVKTLWLLDPDAAGMVRYDYDANGKVVSSTGADGKKYAYDPKGDRIERYPNGRTKTRLDSATGTLYEYLNEDLDGKGSQRVSRATFTDGTVESYIYWGLTVVLKQAKTEKNGVLVQVRLMDESGRVRVRTDHQGAAKTETTYHASGAVRQVSVWNGVQRVSVKRYSASSVIEYEALYAAGKIDRENFYDAQGRLIRVKSHSGKTQGASPDTVVTMSYAYWGSSDRLQSVQVQVGSKVTSVKRYDAKGGLVSSVETEGNRKTETLYWASGKPRQVTVWQGSSRVSQAEYYSSGVMSYLILFKNNRPASLAVYRVNGKPLYTYTYPSALPRR
jgi:YD repeat-containing protein